MPRIDAEHRGPLVNVAALITLVAMILFTFSKVITKWRMVRKLQNDDYFMILAMFTAVGQCVSASVQVQYGLGQPEGILTTSQLDFYQKGAYISQIFYVLTIFLAKVAALQFLMILARPNGPDLRRTIVKGSLGFILVWLVIGVLCISFQCEAPYTWNQASGRCFNSLAFWIVNGVIDLMTQLLIGLAPIYLLFDLQLPVAHKRLAMVSFTPNLTTAPLVVMRLVYLFKAYHISDITMSSFNATLVTVIHTNYSIIASCVPFLKPMIDSLAIGLMTNDIRVPVRPEKSVKNKDQTNPFAILGGKGFHTRNAYGWTRDPTSQYTSTVTAGNENDVELGDLERYGSRDRMVINQTTTTVVSSDPKTALS